MRRDEFPIVEEYCKDRIKAELEEIKAEIKEVQSFSFRTRGECEGLKIALEIIDKHIKEIDNEQKEKQ